MDLILFYHFYINFFLLITREIKLRFLNIKLANYRLLSTYILKHLKLNKSSNLKLKNLSTLRLNFPHLIKFLRLK